MLMMRVSWRHYVLRYAAYVPADAHDGRHVYELMLMMRASSFVHTVYTCQLMLMMRGSWFA